MRITEYDEKGYYIENIIPNTITRGPIIDRIAELESMAEVIDSRDLVAVVRCKDCQYCKEYNYNGGISYECYYSEEYIPIVSPVDYCSNGKRLEYE